MADYLRRLSGYYKQRGIQPEAFACAHQERCSAASSAFTEAKASYVGRHYGGEFPRLVILSLDSGMGAARPADRTLRAVRTFEEAVDLEALDQKKHWYRTHELAWCLLSQIDKGLAMADVRKHFVHVNSAKCCENRPGRGVARSTLFTSCRPHVTGELSLLEPDLLVSQGEPAARAVDALGLRELKVLHRCAKNYCRAALVKWEERTCLVIRTYHPRRFGDFYPQRSKCWPAFESAVRRTFVKSVRASRSGSSAT